jgi:UDP-N-acetylmuramyl pentapeptide phosphotransferase/UDP-N-acetylglucosamine-1-phosphate transferase
MLYTIVAFLGTPCLIFLLRKHAHGVGLVDRPSPRKTHLGEIHFCCLAILLTGFFDDMQEFSARSIGRECAQGAGELLRYASLPSKVEEFAGYCGKTIKTQKPEGI